MILALNWKYIRLAIRDSERGFSGLVITWNSSGLMVDVMEIPIYLPNDVPYEEPSGDCNRRLVEHRAVGAFIPSKEGGSSLP